MRRRYSSFSAWSSPAPAMPTRARVRWMRPPSRQLGSNTTSTSAALAVARSTCPTTPSAVTTAWPRRTPSPSPRSIRSVRRFGSGLMPSTRAMTFGPRVAFVVVDQAAEPVVLRAGLGEAHDVGAELRVLVLEDGVLAMHVAQRHVLLPGVHRAVDGPHRRALHRRGHRERDPIDEVRLAHPAARGEEHPQRLREDEADQQGLTVTLEEGQHVFGGAFSWLRKRLYFHSRSPRGSRMLPEAGWPLAATGEHLPTTPR